MGLYEETYSTPNNKNGLYEESIGGTQEPSLLSRIAERYSKVPIAGTEPWAAPRMAMRAAGQTIGAIGDVAGSALGGVASYLTPDAVKPELKSIGTKIAQSPVGQGASSAMTFYSSLAKKYPELAKDVESAAQIGSMFPITKGAQVAGGAVKTAMNTEAANIAKDVARVGLATAKAQVASPLESNTLIPKVKAAFETAGIRPKDKLRAKEFYENATVAVNKISEYAPEKISDSVRPIETAVEGARNAKTALFAKADAITKASGMEGLPLNNQLATVNDILDPKGKFAKVLADEPALRDEILLVQKNLMASNTATATQIQESLINYNSKAVSREKYSKSANKIHAEISTALNKDLEEGLAKVGGGERSATMKEYGAIKDVEKQLANLAIKEYGAKKFSYLDVLSTSGGLVGLATGNPSLVLASLTTLGTLEGAKHLVSPTRALRNMFKQVEKEQARKEFADTLKSRYMRGQVSSLPTNPLSNQTGGARTAGLLGLAGASGGGAYYLRQHPKILDEILGQGQARETAGLIRQRGLLGE